MAHCWSWCSFRPCLTLFTMFLLAAEACVLVIMIQLAFETSEKEHILEVTFFRKRYAQVTVLLHSFFAGILLLVDFSTLILVACGKYALSKSFILHTAIFQALLNLPFGTSGALMLVSIPSKTTK
uniref:7TM GPCR serpentine receptor class x (Srx) domain-containing protein n=1 Tax=Parascaris univalens TaxID=6257 RepID=A0A915A317_PARUN